jgi:cell wall-associated NlpC family hydrolase
MKHLLLSLLLLLTALAPAAAQVQPADLIEKAMTLQGAPYVYGGTTPSGFDCSGFVYYVFLPWFADMPRAIPEQINYSRSVERDSLKPGDLVFFATVSGISGASHVALYIGNNKIIHAMSEGKDIGVNLSDLDEEYWKKRYLYSRRVLDDSGEQQADPKPDPPPDDDSGNFSDWHGDDAADFQEWLKTH